MLTWTEDVAAKGANEVCTCIYDCLKSINLYEKSIVRQVADGCGGQNKIAMLVTMAMKRLQESKIRWPNISKIEIIFPVTGHSFIPPDCSYGKINKM